MTVTRQSYLIISKQADAGFLSLFILVLLFLCPLQQYENAIVMYILKLPSAPKRKKDL